MNKPFITQIIYRESGGDIVLGFIGEFEGQGVTRKYKKGDPDFMYKGFMHDYKISMDGTKWSRKWLNRTQAISALLEKHGKDPMQGHYHVMPIPETFKKGWK